MSTSCKETGLSYVLSSSINSLSDGVGINLTQLSDFVSLKNTSPPVLCTFAAFPDHVNETLQMTWGFL
jgi:hypothetical protein